MKSILDWVTAVAAVFAAAFICWQSYETRRSANGALSASITANAAIELSRSTLELARVEEKNTRQMISETIKTRLDANAPTLVVNVEPSIRPPALEPSVTGGEPSEIEVNREFTLPNDANDNIILRQYFSLQNDGTRTAIADLPQWRQIKKGGPDRFRQGRFEIAPHVKVEGYFYIGKSFEAWIDIAARSNATISTFEVSVSDEGDAGIIDVYQIVVTGTPFRATDGKWSIAAGSPELSIDSTTAARAEPRKRSYFLSKIDGTFLA
jgi:hypothetical protein